MNFPFLPYLGQSTTKLLAILVEGEGAEEVEERRVLCLQLRWGSSVAVSKGQDPLQKGCHQGVLEQEAAQSWLAHWQKHLAYLHSQQKAACLPAR